MIKPDEQSVLYCGDCRVEMQRLESESVQLVIFSPPYADQRKSTYGGIPPDKYVDWMLPIASELQRVLKPTGTMIINIKEKVVDGERHTYVIDLIKALRQQGWIYRRISLGQKQLNAGSLADTFSRRMGAFVAV